MKKNARPLEKDGLYVGTYMEQQHGILVLDKPQGLSSAQCVGRIKRLGQKKIGHAGTLDPMATGVLLVLLGQATKLSPYLLEAGMKTYSGEIALGSQTDTWDADGQIVAENPVPPLTPELLTAEISRWVGESDQPVPPYSAAKHEGQPLYKLARLGKETPKKVKHITISHAEMLGFGMAETPVVRFRVTCSSGSYIRSLAHSLGMRESLGSCGAHLRQLTREYSHPFSLAQAVSLDTLLAEPESLPAFVVPMEAALNWPTLLLTTAEIGLVKNGRTIAHRPDFGNFFPTSRAFLQAPGGELLALAQAYPPDTDTPLPHWKILRGLFSTT